MMTIFAPMDLKEMRKALKECKNLADVARVTGLSYRHLWDLKRGVVKSPGFKTVAKLDKYFNA